MGILDEAIREHLELKRRRGADPSEIERLEREALGPVRRAPEDASDHLIGDENPPAGTYPVEENLPGWGEGPEDDPDLYPAAEPAPFDHAPVADFDGPPTEHWPAPAPGDEFDEPAPSDYPVQPAGQERRSDLPRHHEIAEEWEAHERQALTGGLADIEPDAPAPTVPAPPASAGPVFEEERQRALRPELEEETAEHRIDEEELIGPEDAEPAEGEDVLEETPDFLQDTPDHDRLWFEQRPPRDFDFDG